MSIVFNADEVFEMAEQIERNGGAFYRKAAQNNPAGRELLLDIANQEDEHLVTLQEMRRALSSRETEATAFDPNNEAALYLKAMADGRVFDVKDGPVKLLKGGESLAKIVKIAIGIEKDSIVFYLGLKDVVPVKLGEDKVMHIIREEMKHIGWLSAKLPA